MLHHGALDLITIGDLVLQKVLIFDAAGPLVEQLGLFIVILDGLCEGGKGALLVERQSQDVVDLVLLLVKIHVLGHDLGQR